jgi:hypothetical protein
LHFKHGFLVGEGEFFYSAASHQDFQSPVDGGEVYLRQGAVQVGNTFHFLALGQVIQHGSAVLGKAGHKE